MKRHHKDEKLPCSYQALLVSLLYCGLSVNSGKQELFCHLVVYLLLSYFGVV